MNLVATWKHTQEFVQDERAGNPGLRWLAASLAALILSVGITCAILGYRWVQRLASPPTLGLQARPTAGQFLVNWDRKAPQIRRARRGVLAIRDGSYEGHLELDPLQLRSGSLVYTSAGANIQFRLEVFGDRGRSVSESIRLLTPKGTGRPETEGMLAQAGVKTGGTLESGAPAAGPGRSETRPATATEGRPPVVQKTRRVSPATQVSPAASHPAQPVHLIRARDRNPHVLVAAALSQSAAPARSQTPAEETRTVGVQPAEPAASPYRAQRTVRPTKTAASYTGPQVIRRVEPVIPAESRASLAHEVRIDVRVGIDAEGAVTTAEVTSGSGAQDPSLASATMRAARQFRFQPARSNDRNVPSGMILSFRFAP